MLLESEQLEKGGCQIGLENQYWFLRSIWHPPLRISTVRSSSLSRA
jgi:hypothetical protein